MTFVVPKFLKNCILRDFTKEDAESLANIEYDLVVKQYVGGGQPAMPRNDGVREVECDPSRLRGWAIEVIPEHVLAGRASLSKMQPASPGTVELQIAIAQSFWGRRLGRQVVAALMQYFFSDPRAIAVIAEVHPENRASLRLLDAFNFIDTQLGAILSNC